MRRADSEQEFFDYFDKRFAQSMSAVLLDIEEETIGTRCGAASWSMPEQVEWMASVAAVGPGDLLLDIGSGSGWPGLAVARLTGASVVLTDVPATGLETAAMHAKGSEIDVTLARADATALPFGDRSFDAVTHSDVLCCLPGKERALEECHRVLTPDGAMVFTVILANEALAPEDARARMEEGNQYVVSDAPYGEMLADAGFAYDEEDVTEGFHELARRTARARSDRTSELVEALGEEEALQMIARSSFNVRAIEDGLLLRRRYIARPSA